ncbi:SRPBCC family protein [Gordonia sp. PDNC005]|uniref:SRPBCC family protein n=1 Tax=unclassified Gordonia (in: high G+C Gram-positive bacteria) TaxID=2657482 RepID=UPI0019669BAC|nr:SRPBCC family protein [Gordonia sp. PDNC005]QRY61104.1 SRPBCC family protein [Gordonia sp. PDNC005]
MPGVRQTVTTHSPREQVFAYVDDYRNVPDWMFGVTRFTPVTDQTCGLGATYQATMKIGPKNLDSTLRVTEWEEGRVLVLTSIAGFDVQTGWRFADGDDGTTVVDVNFDYELPGGIAGRVLGAIIEPVVGQAVKQTESALRAAVEGVPSSS